MSLYFAHCRFNPADGQLAAEDGSGRVEKLRPQASRLLEFLIDNADEVLDRERLADAVWAEGRVVDFEAGLASLVRELRQAFIAVGGQADWIETIPRRGYRLNLPPERVSSQAVPPPPSDEPTIKLSQATRPSSAPADAGPRRGGLRRSQRQRLVLVLSLGLLAAIVLGSLLVPQPAELPTAVGQEHTPALAILPFDVLADLSDPGMDAERLQLVMADRLLAALWRESPEGLALIGRAALGPYRGRDDVAQAVAADLAVDLLVEGVVLASGDNGLNVEARLLQMPQGQLLWSARAGLDAASGDDIERAAVELASAFAVQWPSLRQRLVGDHDSDG
ncbi:MAG: winged helix-turn-helix domain-containing protein [Wenzhouxiangella sp.]